MTVAFSIKLSSKVSLTANNSSIRILHLSALVADFQQVTVR